MISCQSRLIEYPVYTTLISGASLIGNGDHRLRIEKFAKILNEFATEGSSLRNFKNEITQTVFRDSETQTRPYQPEGKEPVNRGLEVLTLGWLSWENGLPAGMREALVIERARQKRAWEKAIPQPFDPDAKKIRNMLLEAIELNEWTYREVELAALNSIQMELAEKCMKENLMANRLGFENRLFKYITSKTEEKDLALQKTKREFNRNLRKLKYKRENINRKYKRMDSLRELAEKTSEFYGPQQRFGVDPRRGHEVIPPEYSYWNVFSNLEVIGTTEQNVIVPERQGKFFDYVNKSKPTKKYKKLCMMETKWTNTYLEKMHRVLKSLRNRRMERDSQKELKLKVKLQREARGFETPKVDSVTDEEENVYQTSLILQKLLKGRAIQAVLVEGKAGCEKLIEELKSTHALQNYAKEINKNSLDGIMEIQRNLELKQLEDKRKNEILQSLEGKVVSEILDFLSKELLRLQNERAVQAMALLAEKARNVREAEEAGRRQKEIQRGREHGEMYKQIVKIYQNSVDITKEEITERIREKFADICARMDAEEYAKKIDQAASEAVHKQSQLEDEEIVADLVHNFALPEVEKIIVRKRLKDRQRAILTACHDEIYSKIGELSRGPRSPSGALVLLPNPRKYHSSSSNYVKFVNLERADSSKSEESSVDDFVIEETAINLTNNEGNSPS